MRLAWLAACVLALLLRLMVPSGWMPVADAGGLRLGICVESGGDPTGFATRAQAAFDDRLGQHSPKPDQPAPHCVFGALGVALVPPQPAPSLTPVVPVAIAAALPSRAGAIGRGLAAPPPPARGPPAFA